MAEKLADLDEEQGATAHSETNQAKNNGLGIR